MGGGIFVFLNQKFYTKTIHYIMKTEYIVPETTVLTVSFEGALLTGSNTGENVTLSSEYDPW